MFQPSHLIIFELPTTSTNSLFFKLDVASTCRSKSRHPMRSAQVEDQALHGSSGTYGQTILGWVHRRSCTADDFNGVRLLFLACVMAEGQEIEVLNPRQYCVLIQQEEGIGQALHSFPSTNHTLRSHDEREKVVKIRIGGLGVVVEFPQCV